MYHHQIRALLHHATVSSTHHSEYQMEVIRTHLNFQIFRGRKPLQFYSKPVSPRFYSVFIFGPFMIKLTKKKKNISLTGHYNWLEPNSQPMKTEFSQTVGSWKSIVPQKLRATFCCWVKTDFELLSYKKYKHANINESIWPKLLRGSLCNLIRNPNRQGFILFSFSVPLWLR